MNKGVRGEIIRAVSGYAVSLIIHDTHPTKVTVLIVEKGVLEKFVFVEFSRNNGFPTIEKELRFPR